MASARFSLLLFLNKDVVLLGYIILFVCFVAQNMFLSLSTVVSGNCRLLVLELCEYCLKSPVRLFPNWHCNNHYADDFFCSPFSNKTPFATRYLHFKFPNVA